MNKQRLQELISAEAGANAKIVKYNRGHIYGTCDLGGLAAAGVLAPQQIDIIKAQVGDPGESLGFAAGAAGKLTYAETNVDFSGTLPSTRLLIVTGVGVRISCPVYDPAGTPPFDREGLGLRMASILGDNLVAGYQRGSKNGYTYGPIGNWSAGGMGGTSRAVATTANAQEVNAGTIGLAAMVEWNDPSAWQYYLPGNSIQYSLDVARQLTLAWNPDAAVAGANPAITAMRCQMILSVFDLSASLN